MLLCFCLKRVDNFQEVKTMKIGVAGTDPADPMLAHEDSGMGVMDQIARQVGKLGNELPGNSCVSIGRGKHSQPRRGEQCRDESPGLGSAPRSPHDPRVRGDTHELIKDWPRRVPRIRTDTLLLQPVTHPRMKRRVGIGGVDKNVGVDDEQRLSSFHRLIECIAIGDVDQSATAVKCGQGL